MNSALRSMFVVFVFASPFAASPAAFAEAADADGVRVRLNDLDLSKPAGVKTLYTRIHMAAVRYCESIYSSTGSRISSGYETCVVDAVNNTVRSLNLPSLSAMHADRGGQQTRS